MRLGSSELKSPSLMEESDAFDMNRFCLPRYGAFNWRERPTTTATSQPLRFLFPVAGRLMICCCPGCSGAIRCHRSRTQSDPLRFTSYSVTFFGVLVPSDLVVTRKGSIFSAPLQRRRSFAKVSYRHGGYGGTTEEKLRNHRRVKATSCREGGERRTGKNGDKMRWLEIAVGFYDDFRTIAVAFLVDGGLPTHPWRRFHLPVRIDLRLVALQSCCFMFASKL